MSMEKNMTKTANIVDISLKMGKIIMKTENTPVVLTNINAIKVEYLYEEREHRKETYI